jgi:hypothetical protein
MTFGYMREKRKGKKGFKELAISQIHGYLVWILVRFISKAVF